MPGINEDRERQVVPLWRSFDDTLRHGELAPLSTLAKSQFTQEMISRLLLDWKDQRGLSVACDLVSVAFTLGLFDVADDAADFVLEHTAPASTAHQVARLYKSKCQETDVRSEPASLNFGEITKSLHVDVHDTKLHLQLYPRNPMLWVNLARLYTSLGTQDKAMRAMRAALSLAPEDRFVLRASSRLMLHLGDRHEAHRLLTDASIVKADPWVLASEIAVAAANNRTSKYIKYARNLVENQSQSPFHLSELASAIGTVESFAGNLKKARQFIGLSLEQPAENAVAQAAWLRRNVGMLGTPEASEAVAKVSHEATAWLACQSAKWTEALHEAFHWQAEQPFSSRPAIIGSYLASSILGEFETGVEFARQGLLSNPDDFALQNNLAFGLILGGKLEEAAKELHAIHHQQLSTDQLIVFNATLGLLAYRSGHRERGRELYKRAIALGERSTSQRDVIARIYLAFEELRAGSPDAEQYRKEAIDKASVLKEPLNLALVERLRKFGPGG